MRDKANGDGRMSEVPKHFPSGLGGARMEVVDRMHAGQSQ